MRFIIYAFLAVALASMVIGIVIGLAVKLIALIVLAALFVAGLTWVMRKLRGESSGRFPR